MSCRTALLVSALVIGISGIAGCATPGESKQTEWRSHSREVAERRLATTVSPHHECPAGGGRTSCPPSSAEAATVLAYIAPASTGRIPADKPIIRLAADTAASPGGAATESPTATSAPAAEAAATKAIQRGPLPTLGASLRRDIREMPGTLWHDTKAVFTDPWNLALLATAGGASIALRTTNADDKIAESHDDRHMFDGCWPDTFGALGNPATHFALAGVWYLAGQQLQQAKTYEVGRKMFSALTITGLSTMFLKVAAWDDSPNGEWGAWPSGHVSSTMAVATVLNHAYGPLVGVPMYGLTALVGIERIDDREHWLSDVVFGAALGWVVAETVMKEHRPEIFGGEVVPYVNPVSGGTGLAWFKSLDAKPRSSRSSGSTPAR